MEIKDRIQEFIDLKGFDIKAFEKEIGISNGLWVKAKTLSEEVLLKFIKRFPEISSEWLLMGEGSMYSGNTGISFIEDNELVRLREENVQLREELEQMRKLKFSSRNDKVYNLWLKFMEITREMQELYKEEKVNEL